MASFSPATERLSPRGRKIGCRQPLKQASFLLMLLRKERLSAPHLIGPEWVLCSWTNPMGTDLGHHAYPLPLQSYQSHLG